MSQHKPLNLYSIFHLNLAFSSIEEEQRAEVIERCYWPLLRMIDVLQLPLAIEASGYTLDEIQRLDKSWIAELKRLCHQGPAEFVGSGYVQLIGPLVPAAVNRWNQKLGLQTYAALLDLRPSLALVSEQAYSASMVKHYLTAGYQGIVMEWDNPSSNRTDWLPEWRYLPQRARGTGNESIPLLWNKSLPFQQFQRYGHGELELEEYLGYLEQHIGADERVFSLYGNDAEIFDFRPGRFRTESQMHLQEWQRLSRLYAALQHDERFRLIPPSAALKFLETPAAGHLLDLQTAAMPVPVKKQAKYNITRWAVTGRDDLRINSLCHRIYQQLLSTSAGREEWRELCYLWSSDFRTHITERRWTEYLQRLTTVAEQQGGLKQAEGFSALPLFADSDSFVISRSGRFLEVVTADQRLRLNIRRGLAIDSLATSAKPEFALLGTLPHGFFDEIYLGADFYSGHLVAEIPGEHKVTDLVTVEPLLLQEGKNLVVCGTIATDLGIIEKRLVIPPQGVGLWLQYRLDWSKLPPAALRLGHITLHPAAFAQESLYFSSHNGGSSPEVFSLNGQPVDHLAPAGSLVSASQGMGPTAGFTEVGDARHRVRVEFNPGQTALTSHIQFRPAGDSYLFRLIFSARELDDTCSLSKKCTPTIPATISLQLSFSKRKYEI